MHELDRSLWVAEAPLRFLGMAIGRRMSVVRLAGGELFVHSPGPLDESLRQELEQLGTVRFIVAPSLLHGHLSMGDYAKAFPDAELIAAPGLARRRRDLVFQGELGPSPDPRWAAEIGQAPLEGHRRLTEVVFCHMPTRSLIVGDACWNTRDGLGLAPRVWAGGRRIGPPPAFQAPLSRQARRPRLGGPRAGVGFRSHRHRSRSGRRDGRQGGVPSRVRLVAGVTGALSETACPSALSASGRRRRR